MIKIQVMASPLVLFWNTKQAAKNLPKKKYSNRVTELPVAYIPSQSY
jgi:hypothetical protein